MELLQGIQMSYINQCDDWRNRILTEIAYIFVILQPLLWNVFFYTNTDPKRVGEKYIFITGIAFSVCWLLANVVARLLYDKTGDNQTRKNSIYAAGDNVCTKKENVHLYWEWTSANFGDFNPTMFMYVLLLFVPPLLTRKFRLLGMILIASMAISIFASYANGELYTITSLWCFVSVPIICIVILYIFANLKKPPY
jgi:hypothetical protein